MKTSITTNLWFDNQAEQAADFYLSIFKDGKKGRVAYYTEEGKDIHRMPAGSVLTIEFSVAGQDFVALNGGPVFQFNESISFIVNCANQEEVDYYWNKLGEGGDEKAQMCGWLKDKYGVSWQIVPTKLTELMTIPDEAKRSRVMKAMFQMKKLDIAVLESAAEE